MSTDDPNAFKANPTGKSRQEQKADRRRRAQAGKSVFKGKFPARGMYYGKAQVLAEMRRRLGIPRRNSG